MDTSAIRPGLVLSYTCDESRLPSALRGRFVALGGDESTRDWLERAYAHPHGPVATFALSMTKAFLSDYDANGLLKMHDMRVLGTDQWQRLGAALSVSYGGRLLDIGAGEGHVTQEIASFFEEVITTETSGVMVRRLRSRGYTCHQVDLTHAPLPDGSGPFDMITLLNVIDRTSAPFALVRRAARLLRRDGVLVIAVPVPLNPHVHIGAATQDPVEVLPTPASDKNESPDFESSVSALMHSFFERCGLDVIGLSRVPYLCRGSNANPVITLDDAIFVCRASG